MSQERVFPTIQKTLTSTIYEFSFIETDGEGNFTETEIQERSLPKSISANALKLSLTKEFPDKVVNLKAFKSVKTRYFMSVEDFIDNAQSEQVIDEPKEESVEDQITLL